MNQDSSFPPMLPPSTELGALLFAVLPCLQESYRPLASFAYHMTELSKLKSIPSVPPLSGLSGVEALISDKDTMFRSLSFYGRMFRMPLLSTIANLLQALQFYQAYKDILPGLFSSAGTGADAAGSSFGNMAGLFSGLNGLGSDSSGPFSALGGLSPDLLSSLFSGFSRSSASNHVSSVGGDKSSSTPPSPATEQPLPVDDTRYTGQPLPTDITSHTEAEVPAPIESTSDISADAISVASQEASGDLFDSLYTFLTPEQKKIYEQLMHTD